MDLDPQKALTTLQAGFAELSSLLVSYAFSAVGAVILLIIGYIVAGLAQRSVNAGLGKIHGFDATLRGFFAKVARYAVLILVVVMVLGQFGVQTASIIAAIGAIGLAIGLALQGTLQNIAAGIMLLALRPFRIGEYVEAGGISGTVEEIGLFATRLRAIDGLYVLAPNSTLWNVPVTNYSRNERRRNDVTIGIGYGDDIDLAQKTLLDLAEGRFARHGRSRADDVCLRTWRQRGKRDVALLDVDCRLLCDQARPDQGGKAGVRPRRASRSRSRSRRWPTAT